MTNKNSTAFIFKTYRQPITVINLTEPTLITERTV